MGTVLTNAEHMPDAEMATALTAQRALAFSWLADVFLVPPTRETVASYRRGDRVAWLAELEGDDDLATGIRAVMTALNAEVDDEDMTSHLGIAFGRLFAGIGGPNTVAPYESAYCGNGHLFQAPVSEMKQFIAETGLSVDRSVGEPPDHLSIELTFAAHLIFAGHPRAEEMLGRLQNWIPRFCADCVCRDATGFYAGAALALDGLVSAECRNLSTRSEHHMEDGNIR